MIGSAADMVAPASNGAVAEMGADFILPGNTEVAALAEELAWGSSTRGCATAAASREAASRSRTPNSTPRSAGRGRTRRGDRRAERAGLPRVARDPRRAARGDPGQGRDRRPAVPTRSRRRDLQGIAHIGDEPSPGVAGGNQGLALALAARLGDRVRLADPVELIRWSASGVTVGPGRDARRKPTAASSRSRRARSSGSRSSPSCRRASATPSRGCATATRRSCSSRWPSRRPPAR